MKPRSSPSHHNSAQATRPASPTIPPATTWPASLFLVVLGGVEALVAVPEPLADEEDDADELLDEDEEEEDLEEGPLVEDAIC